MSIRSFLVFYEAYKILEQQINPQVLSVVNSCHYNENSKNGKNCLYTNALPSGATPTNPPPGQKLGCESPRVGANFWCKSPGVRGGVAMDEIDTCIMLLANRYFKGVGSAQTSISSPNTLQITTARNHCAMFVFFSFLDLCTATALLHQSLKSSARPGNRFPWGNHYHISFIRAIKSGVLTMLIQKICHKDLLHLQKIVF